MIKITLILFISLLYSFNLNAKEDCSKYSKIFPIKYNTCMAKNKENDKVENKNLNLNQTKTKVMGGIKNLNKKYKELREKAPTTLQDFKN